MATRSANSCRVLHLTEAAGGGVRQHLRYLVPALAERGIVSEVAVFSGRVEEGFSEDLRTAARQGCRVHSLMLAGHSLAACWPTVSHWYRELLSASDCDLVHAHATWAGILARSGGTAGGRRLPVVYSPHAFAFQAPGLLRRGISWAVERILASRTACYALVSQGEFQVAASALGVESARLCLAQNGLPSPLPRGSGADLRRAWGIGPERILAVVPGRLCRQKGQDWLLRALVRLDMARLNLVVAFCGEGPWKARLQRRAAAATAAGYLLWPGFVPSLSSALSAADLVILPSRYEGLSYALLESLVQGLPLVVSDIPANRPSASVARLLRSVPVDDAAALAAALTEVCAALPQWKDRAAAGAAGVAQEFSLARQADILADLYCRLKDRPAPSQAGKNLTRAGGHGPGNHCHPIPP